MLLTNIINKDFLKQVHRKINAKNCTFRQLLVVIFNSKYANNLYEKTIFKLNKMFIINNILIGTV